MSTVADSDLPDRHHLHYLSDPAGSFALISPRQIVSTAIVFVHGFCGDATGTWAEFQQVVDDHPELRDDYASADLFFFEYRGIWESINSSVDRFDNFVKNVVLNPNSAQWEVDLRPLEVGMDEPLGEIAPEPPQGSAEIVMEPRLVSVMPGQHLFRRLVLVAHSEGGVVVRKAILEDYRRGGASRLLDAEVALFAPALFGYAPSGLLGVIANFPAIGRVVDAFLMASPAYRDLQPKSATDMLEELRTKTEALQHVARAFRASVIWGREDRVLKDGKYDRDTSEYVDDVGHVAICKPTRRYELPVSFVASKLK